MEEEGAAWKMVQRGDLPSEVEEAAASAAVVVVVVLVHIKGTLHLIIQEEPVEEEGEDTTSNSTPGEGTTWWVRLTE